MLIRSVRLENFLSFGSQSEATPLEKLNVIIGPNASGKSNFLEAIALLRSVPAQLQRTIREGGGVENWLRKDGSSNTPVATVDVVVDNQDRQETLRYSLSFTAVNGRFEITDEKVENEEPYQGKEHPDHYPKITSLARQFEKIKLYREWSFGRYPPARLAQKTDLPNNILEPDGSNLALVLNHLESYPGMKKKFLEALQQLYDGIDDYQVIIESSTVQVFLREGDIMIPATRLSDGTLRYLCLLAILLNPMPPPLVCIEEPELGIHPDILPTLANVIKEASERCQLIITTHSDILVDEMTDTPESVIVCEKEREGTVLRRLRADDLKHWLGKYRLGELWTSGEIGGNRW